MLCHSEWRQSSIKRLYKIVLDTGVIEWRKEKKTEGWRDPASGIYPHQHQFSLGNAHYQKWRKLVLNVFIPKQIAPTYKRRKSSASPLSTEIMSELHNNLALVSHSSKSRAVQWFFWHRKSKKNIWKYCDQYENHPYNCFHLSWSTWKLKKFHLARKIN